MSLRCSVRIVSLLPSATEIICRLGLDNCLVGVTHECDFPAAVRRLPKVTKTLIASDLSSGAIDQLVRQQLNTQRALYSLDTGVLESLQPELIVTQALCDVCAVSEHEVHAAACQLPGKPRVINLEPMSLDEVLLSLLKVGEAAGVAERAGRVVEWLRSRIRVVQSRSAEIRNRPKVVMLEWIDPPFSCGHWSPELIQLAGGDEQLGQPGVPSRTLDWNEVVAAEPDVIIIACCGYDVTRTMNEIHILRQYPNWSEIPAVKNGQVFVVDGSAYFNRPGPRLIESLELIAHAMHPSRHPAPAGLEPALRLP